MSLADIKDKLYKKEADKDLSKHAESEFDATSSLAGANQEKFTAADAWEEKKEGLGEEQKKIVKYGVYALGGILLIVAIVFGVYKYNQSSFSPDRLTFGIIGAKEVESGKLVTYEISYKNDNRATLKNAVLRLNFPDSFTPEDNPSFISEGPSNGRFDLGEIKGRDQGKIIFRGKAMSPKGSLIYIKAELSYTPSNFNSQFVTQDQLGVNVISFPVTLEILAPQNLASGDALDYLISYKNTSTEDFENIKLKLEFPEGFVFSKADPVASESNNTWYIGHLSAGQAGKVIISGKMNGASDEVKMLRADLGSMEEGGFVSYNKETISTKIEVSPMSIAQTVNGLTNFTAKAGDSLGFEITFKNNGSVGLRDVIITEKLDSLVLDYKSLVLKAGAFNSSNNTIIWKASDFRGLANLEPGQEGKISFSIKVKDPIPVKSANDKNFTISSMAKIDSPDIATPVAENKIIAGNTIDIKIGTRVGLIVKGYYNDAVLKNSGPIPPVVGKATTFSLHWFVFNTSNDIADAKVETSLPTGVSMTSAKFPSDANLSYNERNNTVVWNIGNLPAGTGIITPPKELIFQVKIVPAPNQVNNSVALAGVSTFSARDLFTGGDLSAEGGKKDTMLTEDPAMGFNYKVQPAP